MPTLMERQALGANLVREVYRVTFADFTAAATSEVVALGTLPAGAMGIKARVRVIEGFGTSGSHTAMALTVGVSGDTDTVMGSVDVFGASAGYLEADGTGQGWSAASFVCEGTASHNLGDGTDPALDAGEANIELYYYRIVN